MKESFLQELNELLKRNNVYLSGDVRVYPADEAEENSQTTEARMKLINCGGLPYYSGPYIFFDHRQMPTKKSKDEKSKAAYIQRDIEPYQCPVTGDVVGGRAQHRDNLKRHDCHILEPGEREYNEKRRIEEHGERLRRDVQDAVYEAIRD